MGKPLFGWPIYSDVGVTYSPALSGGSWLAALPLSNLQDSSLSVIARSTDATTGSTTGDIDLGVARAVRLLSLVNHNLTSSATVRWRGYSDAFSTLVYDSTALTAWPSGVDAEEYDGYVKTALHITTTAQTLRYWRFSIADTGNAAGYVDVGRLVIAGGFEPSTYPDADAGLDLSWVDTSTHETMDGGEDVSVEQRARRQLDFVLNELTLDESLDSAFEMQCKLKTVRQVFAVIDQADTTHLHQRSFLARFRELAPIQYKVYPRGNFPVRLVEVI